MEKLSFKEFFESMDPHPFVQNALRVNMGIDKKTFPKALPGMFPSIDSQLKMSAGPGKKGTLQASVVPVDWEAEPDFKGDFQYKAKFMGKESPYVYFSNMDIVKPQDKQMYIMPKDVDKLMFMGQNLPQVPAKKKGVM
jgi:hypothetical protein